MRKSEMLRIKAIHTATEDILKGEVKTGYLKASRNPEKEIIEGLLKLIRTIENVTRGIIDENRTKV